MICSTYGLQTTERHTNV